MSHGSRPPEVMTTPIVTAFSRGGKEREWVSRWQIREGLRKQVVTQSASRRVLADFLIFRKEIYFPIFGASAEPK